MKKIITICAAIIMTASLWAQSPEKMSYQAVVRDGSNNLVTSSAVGMQISILQGSPSGTAVYVETQTPTTNANGLVSIEIGAGTVVSGDFTTINWANGPYFIKTETDPTGSTNYTITGTSQLLSVPYALHAKTAESISGGIAETDPIFGASVASGITGTDTTNWNNKLDSYTETDPVFGASVASGITGADTTYWNNKLDSYTETDPIFGASVASGITGADTTYWNNKQDQLTAGTGINITGNTVSAKTYSVGDFAHGGIVFWVDETGQHGLVCAKEDQSTGIQWYNGNYPTVNAVRDGIGAGMYNTERIIANQGVGSHAAQLCANYQGGGYGDWYLPSKAEVNLMYQNKTVIDATATVNGGSGFAITDYWSSTEDNISSAWVQYFDSGYQVTSNKGNTGRVRAVRAF